MLQDKFEKLKQIRICGVDLVERNQPGLRFLLEHLNLTRMRGMFKGEADSSFEAANV